MTQFLTKAFQGQEVNMFCGGKEWISGKVEQCTNGMVTVMNKQGAINIQTENILSVHKRH